MSKIIVPKDTITRWKNVSVKINSLAPNCDIIARKINSMKNSKIGKSSSYYNDFSVSKDSLLTKISVLIIELSSSAESFQNVDRDLDKRIKKSIFDDNKLIPGKIVSYKLLSKLKNQRTVLQKIFSVSKNLDTDYRNQKLSDCEWILDCILQDRLLNSILNRDEIVDKTLHKLRELSKFAFSVYEDKVNEQILSESREQRSTTFSKTSETDGIDDIKEQLKDQTTELSNDPKLSNFEGQFNQSFKFPGGISRINKGKTNLEDNKSFLEDIEKFENTILKSPDNFYDSKLSNFDDNLTTKNQSRFQRTKRKKFKKRKNRKERLKEKKMMDFLGMDNLITHDSIMSETNQMRLSHLIGSNANDKIEEKDTETETESDFETPKKKYKKVVIRNDIGKIDQKISVSNFNCSCRVF
jgi:hypothetical protein